MTLKDYLDHYLVPSDMLTFLGLAFVCTFISVLFIVVTARLTSGKLRTASEKVAYYDRARNLAQRYYEMIFSSSSILSFLSAYYLIERFVTEEPFREFWNAHSDMLLLVMIVTSCVINTALDRIIVPLKRVTDQQKGSVRLIAMLYIILIFVYIKYIYENNNYDGFIIYFLGLMVGRFVYFDASFTGFLESVREASHNLPMLLLGLSNTGIMCLYGFTTKYLLRSNGVLVSTFIAHVYLIAAIFIIYHLRLIHLFVRKPKKEVLEQAANESMDDRYEEGDYVEDHFDEYEDEYDDYDGYAKSGKPERYKDYEDEFEDYDEYDDYGEYDNREEYDGR